MISKKTCIIVMMILSFMSIGYTSESDDQTLSDSAVTLLNSLSTARLEKGDSLIYIYFNFDNSSPNYFYEISQTEKKIKLTFVNTKLGGFAEDDTNKVVNLGPVKEIKFAEQIKNKNEAVRGLTPELYRVVNVVINCEPVIKDENSFDIVEKDHTLSIMMKWPGNKKARKEIYFYPKKKKTGLALTITGIGLAGLAVGGYFIYQSMQHDANDPDYLQPVLPAHPIGQ